MEALLNALADPARSRIVMLLAERPGSVGVLAKLAGIRQPQATKHLQTLERAGIVTSQRIGRSRVYELQPGPLKALAGTLQRLAESAQGAGGLRETGDQSTDQLTWEVAGWPDDRSFECSRSLEAAPEVVWRYLTEPALLEQWSVPADVHLLTNVFEPTMGGRVLLEYCDAEDRDDEDAAMWRVEGVVVDAVEPRQLSLWSSPLQPDGSSAFTAHFELSLTPTLNGTDLLLQCHVTNCAIKIADFLPGLEADFGQTLNRLGATLPAD